MDRDSKIFMIHSNQGKFKKLKDKFDISDNPKCSKIFSWSWKEYKTSNQLFSILTESNRFLPQISKVLQQYSQWFSILGFLSLINSNTVWSADLIFAWSLLALLISISLKHLLSFIIFPPKHMFDEILIHKHNEGLIEMEE